METADNNGVTTHRPPGRALEPTVLLVAVLLSCLVYLWRSSTIIGLGFPLDDAWIHQTYARNLVSEGEWAFVPGHPSAGSTAPLWTAMVAAGRAVGVEPRLWTYSLGVLSFFALAWGCVTWMGFRGGLSPGWRWLFAGLMVFEWHLVWAAVSGMETLALALAVVLVLRGFERGEKNYTRAGALMGMAVWIRPDALTLLLPAGWIALSDGHRDVRRAARDAAMFGAGFVLTLLPYFVLQAWLGQEWFPSTFYAKQAEYAVLRTQPLLTRFLALLSTPLVGAGVCLLPGLIADLRRIVAGGAWRYLGAYAWIAGYVLTYALRLPVTYQHGRYVMPVIPVLIALSVRGMSRAVKPGSSRAWERVLARGWIGVVVVVSLAFWWRGGQAYGEDVGIIETEMVETARWVEENTGVEARIAAHDIGALGYFAHRDLIDLAGLVSPEVIPILRDEAALEAFLNEQGADYLVTFPGWYPRLVQGLKPVYQTGGQFSPRAGGENMAVYRWGSAH
jgi:hypothetical protein